MIFSRMGAAIFVVLLMGVLGIVGISVTAWLGPMSTHGTNVMSVHGEVINVGPGKNFTFEVTDGRKLFFICSTNCRASERHLIRHLKEDAATDVYYISGPNKELIAIDAD